MGIKSIFKNLDIVEKGLLTLTFTNAITTAILTTVNIKWLGFYSVLMLKPYVMITAALIVGTNLAALLIRQSFNMYT